MRQIRLGMVGGGQGAFIGAVHRIAARLDDRFSLVAGALSSDPERARISGLEIGLDPARTYTSFETMAKSESQRDDGIEAVAIVTPNDKHASVAIAFLRRDIHVICDKPLCASMDDADRLARAVRASQSRFILTHNYTAYPLIRHARALVARGDLGTVRLVQAEYAQDWLSRPLEREGHKQASWRVDPKQAGAGAIGDIGTHAFNLVGFVTGLRTERLSASLHRFGAGRQLDDNAHILMDLERGARAMLWVSQVAVGNENALRIRVYGDKGGLEWEQENPNRLLFAPIGEPKRILTRGGAGVGDAYTRLPPGHPEGYLEGFATLYAEVADLLEGRDSGALLPSLRDGLEGMWFIQAAQKSSRDDGRWIANPNDFGS